MIIKKIRAIDFGKLNNKEIELNSSINIIYGKNESGKSTLQALIRAMLYGLGSKNRSIKENDRLHFIPWGKDKIEAEMEIDEVSGSFLIKRSFGKTKSKDELFVYNSVSGANFSDLENKEVGEYFLNIGEEGFSNTIFIKQLGNMIKKSNDDEIIKKLSNLQETGNEDISYNKARDILLNSKKSLITIGNKGKINVLKQEIARLKSESASLNVERERINSQKLLQSQKEAQLNELFENQKKAEKTKQYLKNYIAKKDIESIEKIKNEIIELENIKKELTNKLNVNGSCFSEEILKKHKEIYSNYQKELEKFLIFTKNEQALINKLEGLKLENEKFQETKKKQKRNYIIFSSLSVIFSAICFVFGNFLGKIFNYFATFLIFLFVFFIYKLNNKNEFDIISRQYLDVKNEYESYQNQKLKLEQEISELEISFIKEISIFQKVQNIKEAEKALNELENVYFTQIEIEKNIIAKKETLEILMQNKNIDDKISLGDLNDSDIITEIKSINEAEKILSEINNSLIDITKEITQIKEDITHSVKNLGDIFEIDELLNDLEIQLNENVLYYDAIQIAIDTLQCSFEEIQRVFGKKLNQKVSFILNSITNGKYNDIMVSEDYDIRLINNQTSDIKELDYFSNGTYDLVYFAIRLSIAEIIFEKLGKIPLILDDVFLQYDDERLNLSLQYLEKLSEKWQIILFTCHKREVDYFKKNKKVNIINL